MTESQRRFIRIMDSMQRMKFPDCYMDLNPGELRLMRDLSHCLEEAQGGKVTVSAIVRKANAPAPAISRILRVMEKKDLICRNVDPEDRRNTLVDFTEPGYQKMSEMKDLMEDYVDRIMFRMGEKDMAVFLDGLEKLVQIAREECMKTKL